MTSNARNLVIAVAALVVPPAATVALVVARTTGGDDGEVYGDLYNDCVAVVEHEHLHSGEAYRVPMSDGQVAEVPVHSQVWWRETVRRCREAEEGGWDVCAQSPQERWASRARACEAIGRAL